MERIERSSVAHRATALTLSYIGWSQRGYSKPRPPRYECGAPPLELLRRGASAENRTPFVGLAVQCPTNGRHSQTLERTEIIEISSLGWRPRAHPIYHARIDQYSIIKDQWEPVQSHFDLLTSRRKSVGQFTTKVPDKTQKGAATFGGRPSS